MALKVIQWKHLAIESLTSSFNLGYIFVMIKQLSVDSLKQLNYVKGEKTDDLILFWLKQKMLLDSFAFKPVPLDTV